MVMWFAILTIQTLTFLGAFHTSSKTLAIIFAALRFFAGASSDWNESWYSFKCSGVSKICHLLGFINLILTIGFIATTIAFTSFVAESSFRKTFAIHFKAVNFGAFTALVIL